MAEEDDRPSVADAMRVINQAWLNRRVDDMAPVLHPGIVMVVPGFSGEVRGRDAFLAGFRDFVENAAIDEFREGDQMINVIDRTAVMTLTYEMVYVRAGERYRATGRDVWVFQREDTRWIAVWRTMMDLSESPV